MKFRPAPLCLFLVAIGVAAVPGRGTEPAPVIFTRSVIDAAGPVSTWGKGAADLNGDGRIDLLAGGWRSGGLVWYEAPHWAKHAIDASAKVGTDIEVSDVDRDGRPDVISVTTDSITWYRSPDWKPFVITNDVVHDIEVGDFDSDGDTDIMARNQQGTNASGAMLFMFFREATGEWTRTAQPIPDGEGLKAADIDEDGDIDAVVNGVWLENPGSAKASGTWPTHVFGPDWKYARTFVDFGDLNGDGLADIVLSPSERRGARYHISWFEAPTDRRQTWTEHIVDPDVETVHHAVAIADYNRDGHRDIGSAAMLNGPAPREVKIYLNNGQAASWTKQVIGLSGGHSMRVVDVVGDGTPSLFSANHTDNKIDLWRNLTPHGKLSLDSWERHVIDSARPWKAYFITAQDIDADGFKDIIAGAWWYKNPGVATQTWERRVIGEPLNNMAAVHDFDGDGYSDILGTPGKDTEANPALLWARNDGRGKFTIHQNIPAGTGDFLQGVIVGRFGRYGAMATPLGVALSWHNGTGKGVQMLTVSEEPTVRPWHWRYVSPIDQQEELTAWDIDDDMFLDLVLGTRWLKNSGRDSWQDMPIGATPDQPDRHRLADMNGDGRLDVLATFRSIDAPAKIAWFEAPAGLAGHTPWIEHVIATDVIAPMSLDAGDLDGDGDVDFAVGENRRTDPQHSQLIVFENPGRSGINWKRHVVANGDTHHNGSQFVDIDNDGDLDIASVGWRSKLVLLYENKAIDRTSK